MAKKTARYAKLSVYPSVKRELAQRVTRAKKTGGDTNISRILHRALMALEEKEAKTAVGA